jgi:hypothetical protein
MFEMKYLPYEKLSVAGISTGLSKSGRDRGFTGWNRRKLPHAGEAGEENTV